MGRQSARLWHNGEDHKDFWKLIDDEDTFLKKSWRMHWQIYKGNKLIWSKLPPNFLTVELVSSSEIKPHIYESVYGKKFTDIGFLKSYVGNHRGVYVLCKVGKYLCSLSSTIIYTDNCYSWKELKIDLGNFYGNEKIISIKNYNDRLLIYTNHRIAVYDIETSETKIIYQRKYDLISYAENQVYVQKDTLMVIVSAGDQSINPYANNDLLIFKNDELVKEILQYSTPVQPDGSFTYGTYFKQIVGDGKTAYFKGTAKIIANTGREEIFFSMDGITWEILPQTFKYLTDELFSVNGELYSTVSSDTDFVLKYRNGDFERIENNVNAAIDKSYFIVFGAKGYIYCNCIDEDGNYRFTRFKDFDSNEYEIINENPMSHGIYIENWED